MLNILQMFVMFMMGFLVCFGIMYALKDNKKPIGTLRIDHSDPEESPYLFLELSEDPRKLMSKQYVTLKVNIKSYISQK